MYHWKFADKLTSCLKFRTLLRNYSEQVERGGLDPKWETRYFSMKDRGPVSLVSVDTLALLHRTTLTWSEIKARFKWKQEVEMRKEQGYLPEREKILGPDLAVAHFITYREGKVKFKGRNDWMTYEHIANDEIPSRFVPNIYLEAVDASGTNLCYEGFENFTRLHHINTLILRNCHYIDDWCLHRLNMFESSLEHLNISGCHNVSERGLCALHGLRNLKTLILDDTPNIANKELSCLLLQDILPQCNIVGVSYENPSLWNRLKEYLI